MHHLKFCCLCALVSAINLLPNSALSVTAANSEDQVRLLSKNELHLAQQCSQRIGPFATQTTAWQRWREAKRQGKSVSNGVVPCYSGGSRGYCFFIYSC